MRGRSSMAGNAIVGRSGIMGRRTNHHNRSPFVWTHCFDTHQQVMGGIGDLQKFLCRNLGRTGVSVVGKLDGCPSEALASKFFS